MISIVVEGAAIGVGAGLFLAVVTIALLVWARRRRQERRKQEALLGPTPFLAQPQAPPSLHNINLPPAPSESSTSSSSSKRKKRRAAEVVYFTNGRPPGQASLGIPRAVKAYSKRNRVEVKENQENGGHGIQAVPQAHLSPV